MEISITFTTDNAAFDHYPVREALDVIDKAMEILDEFGNGDDALQPFAAPLRDSNGNRIGTLTVSDTPA
jgi:hypothetical protein